MLKLSLRHEIENKPKEYIIWGVIVLLILIIVIFIVIKPGKEKSIEIKDRCGPIMNLISHTVPDESVCKTRCNSQCEAIELRFSRIDFQKKEIGCHSCTCFCKESLFG